MLGEGGEARAFVINDGSVLRVNRKGTSQADVSARISLLSRLALRAELVSFEIPQVRDHGFECGHHFTIEDRLHGAPMRDALSQCTGSERENLVHDYLETSTQLSRLMIGETQYGEFAMQDGILCPSFKEFLRERSVKSLAQTELDIDLEAIIEGIEEPEKPQLVHLDYYPANVMCANGKVTAVLDFGGSTIAGSAVFNPIIAAAFLNQLITPSANENDTRLANDWLAENGLTNTGIAVRKWLATYWSFCEEQDDPALFRWCRAILSS